MLKVLIPRVFVTKLIGAKGSMIQEIASASGGATIKILSNKESEQRNNSQDIVVSVAGNINPIQKAIGLLMEQLESFKAGGPVKYTKKGLELC